MFLCINLKTNKLTKLGLTCISSNLFTIKQFSSSDIVIHEQVGKSCGGGAAPLSTDGGGGSDDDFCQATRLYLIAKFINTLIVYRFSVIFILSLRIIVTVVTKGAEHNLLNPHTAINTCGLKTLRL